MTLLPLSLGTENDTPLVSDQPFVWRGENIRVRIGRIETVGLIYPMNNDAGGGSYSQISLGVGTGYWRTGLVGSFGSNNAAMAILGAVNMVVAMTTGTGIEDWDTTDITPAALPSLTDGMLTPTSVVWIPYSWWFAEQDDVIIAGRAGAAEAPFSWDKALPNNLTTIANTGTETVPQKAVAAAIVNRILVLLGATSVDDPTTGSDLTIRWSDRFDFGMWDPLDTNSSGEIQLEGGSRIMGGGAVSGGIVVWTDKNMAFLREIPTDAIFEREYIDGGRGLLANRAWCEADGVVFWLDQSGVLNAYDGGKPRQIPNTNKMAYIETNIAPERIWITPNHEFGEIIINLPTNTDGSTTRQLVYNYLYDVWYPWAISRSAWLDRVGPVHPVSVDSTGDVWFHEMDVAFEDPYVSGGTSPLPTGVTAPESFSWSFETNLITTDSPSTKSWSGLRLLMDTLFSDPSNNNDSVRVTVTGYGSARLTATSQSEFQDFDTDDIFKDYRVAGQAIKVEFSGTNHKSLWRFGNVEITAMEEGER